MLLRYLCVKQVKPGFTTYQPQQKYVSQNRFENEVRPDAELEARPKAEIQAQTKVF